MLTTNSLNKTIADIGPALPELISIVMRGDDEWLIRYPDLDITLEFDAATQRIMLSIELSTVDAMVKAETLTRLLHYSYLWRDTGCVYFSLNAALRPVLMVPLFAEEVTTEMLANVVAHMVEKSRAWRMVIETVDFDAHSDEMRPNEIRI